MWSNTSQTQTQFFTPFGCGYVLELRSEETRGYLAPPEAHATVDFGAILKSLRAALSLR